MVRVLRSSQDLFINHIKREVDSGRTRMLRRRYRSDSTWITLIAAGQAAAKSKGLLVDSRRTIDLASQRKVNRAEVFHARVSSHRCTIPPLTKVASCTADSRNTPVGASQTFASYLSQSSPLLLAQFPLWQILVS